MQLLYRINRAGTTVIVATHDNEMVDKMRRRVIELKRGRIIRDEATGLYARRATGDGRAPEARNRGRAARRGRRAPMKLGFFLKEAVRSMRRNPAPSSRRCPACW